MNEREALLQKLSTLQFAAWELHLYLDTHPCDKDALELQEKYQKMSGEIKRMYESKYGPLTARSGSGEVWLKNPWPWNFSECEE